MRTSQGPSYFIPPPRFSEFIHGVASLFEAYVNRLLFWLSDLETNIRKDPLEAFEEEEQRRAERTESEQAVGSYLGNKIGSFKVSTSLSISKSYLAERIAAQHTATAGTSTESAAPSEDAQRSSGYGQAFTELWKRCGMILPQRVELFLVGSCLLP